MPSVNITAFILAALLIAMAGLIFRYVRNKLSTSEEYSAVKAFNSLANGNSSIAFSELKKIALSGNASIEIYSALSVLYRKNHELLKAIHLNESILLRDKVSDDVSEEILDELIKCYLLEPDVSVIKKFVSKLPADMKSNKILILNSMMENAEGNFSEAVKLLRRYEKNTKEDQSKQISDIYCAQALSTNELSKRIKLLKQAADINPQNRIALFAIASSYINADKNDAALSVYRDIIKNNLIRSKEDLELIEDSFYSTDKLNELYKLMEEKVLAGDPFPAPYLFIYSYQRKRGNYEKAEAVLSDYLSSNKSAVILKEYIRSKQDVLLSNFVPIDAIYICNVCGAKYSYFSDKCSECASVDSLNFN